MRTFTLTGNPPTSQKGSRPTPPPRQRQRNSRRTCFGCGSPGHVIAKCARLVQREKQGEFRRVGLSLELPNGRVLRKQNRNPPLLSQLDDLQRQIEGEGDLHDKSCSTSPTAPRPDKAAVSISNKHEAHRLPKSLAPLEPTPPDPIVYRSVAVATSPPPTLPVSPLAPPSERVRAVIRHNMNAPFAVCVPPEPEQSVAYVIFRCMLTPAQAANVLEGLAYRGVIHLASNPFTTVEEARRRMFGFDMYRTSHPVIGDFIILAGERNFSIQPFELQVNRNLRAVDGLRNSQGYYLGAPAGDTSRCTHTAHHVISTLIAFKDVINAQEFQENDRTRRRRRFSAPNSEIAAMYATDDSDSDGLVVHWLARRALVRRLRPIIELAQDLGLERFLRTFRNLDPEDHAELQLALTALFLPKQQFDGNPYLDPVEEIEALQARVFFAISNQYHGYVAETLDNTLAYRASDTDNETIQGYRRRGIFGGHWSVPTFPQDFRDICLETFQRAV
ncbi:hypothetical protein BC629DRAFT_1434262 [Irpex lacteus]|nr:hypothetical protein BC629DRAFT_1434262 [Irpex lacteus]